MYRVELYAQVRRSVFVEGLSERETAKIDTLVAKIETAIERLQEYRTVLITAAVTGKIDVRPADVGVTGGQS